MLCMCVRGGGGYHGAFGQGRSSGHWGVRLGMECKECCLIPVIHRVMLPPSVAFTRLVGAAVHSTVPTAVHQQQTACPGTAASHSWGACHVCWGWRARVRLWSKGGRPESQVQLSVKPPPNTFLPVAPGLPGALHPLAVWPVWHLEGPVLTTHLRSCGPFL